MVSFPEWTSLLGKILSDSINEWNVIVSKPNSFCSGIRILNCFVKKINCTNNTNWVHVLVGKTGGVGGGEPTS